MRIVAMAAGLLWLAAVLTGSFLLLRYSQTPGLAATPPAHWPESSLVPHQTGRPNLVMFLHPQCPCSRASVGELEQLMTHCQGEVTAQVLMIQPAGMTEAWAKTSLWQALQNIPGVTVSCDPEGIEARRFQAETSGQTMLYDANGNLLFQGGITVARGHAGDNAGRDAVEALLKHQLAGPARTSVFGCSLCKTEIPTGGVAWKQ